MKTTTELKIEAAMRIMASLTAHTALHEQDDMEDLADKACDLAHTLVMHMVEREWVLPR